MSIFSSFFYAFWIIVGFKVLFWVIDKLREQYPIFLQEYMEEQRKKEEEKLMKKEKKGEK